MAIYYTLNKSKLYIGITKVKNAYLGATKIYSSGEIVTYIVDGSVFHTQEYEEGQSVLSPIKSPTKSGYTFAGWATSASGDVVRTLVMADKPITLYARFVQTSAWNFAYTGGIQSFVVPLTGLYLLRCNGAPGGYCTNFDTGKNTGGSSARYVALNAGTTLYVVCGGAGGNTTKTHDGTGPIISGGYNGGGSTKLLDWDGNGGGAAGGGATHIATRSGLLPSLASYKSSILIVAGGGGGNGCYGEFVLTAGNGGGNTGGNGSNYSRNGNSPFGEYGKGATQTDGGGTGAQWNGSDRYKGSFGQGANTTNGVAGGGGGILVVVEALEEAADQDILDLQLLCIMGELTIIPILLVVLLQGQLQYSLLQHKACFIKLQ